MLIAAPETVTVFKASSFMSGKGNEARVSAKQLKERGARVRSEQGNVAHACSCFACAFALVFPEGKGQDRVRKSGN